MTSASWVVGTILPRPLTGAIDEILIVGERLSAEDAFTLYVDAVNNFRVNQHEDSPAVLSEASFFKEFYQNLSVTINSCPGDALFVYADQTTHPPTEDSPKWQPCNEYAGGIYHPPLDFGYRELKLWTKDAYGNISIQDPLFTSYLRVDTQVDFSFNMGTPRSFFTFDSPTRMGGQYYTDIFGQHKALIHGPTVASVAIQDEGVSFNRASEHYLEIKHASHFQVRDELTISVWADMTSRNAGDQVIVGNRTGAGHGYSIEIAGDDVLFRVESEAGERSVGVSRSAFGDRFYQLVGSYDGEWIRFYVNGDLWASHDYSATPSPIAYTCLSSFTIGGRASCDQGSSGSDFYQGTLDDLVVWDRVFSEAEVLDFFLGQDSVPPEPVAMYPRNDEYEVGIPVAKFNADNCDGIASVYVTLLDARPLSSTDGWQACSTSGDLIESPLLADGTNELKFWFKDASGNVSIENTLVEIEFDFDFTIPAPLSYWPFDDANREGATIYDVVDDIHGTEFNTTRVGEGVAYEALEFNGSSSRIVVPFDSNLRPTDRITLSAWIKSSDYNVGSDQFIAGNLRDGGYALVLAPNSIEFRVWINGAQEVIAYDTTELPLPTDEWHNIIGVYDDGDFRLFINGDEEEVSSLDPAGAPYEITYVHDNAFAIGAQASDGDGVSGGHFAGKIDEVAFWPMGLTDVVAEEIYNRGQGGDKVYYNVDPPEVPESLGITYYNSLVSRANLTVDNCDGIDYMIVTDSDFPPNRNDPDWQLCNTLVGGLLSKELGSHISFGRLWTKDISGNVSTSFENVFLETPYDLPIARPIAHWTFDSAHYDSSTRIFLDRIGRVELLNEAGRMVAANVFDNILEYQVNPEPADLRVSIEPDAVLFEGVRITGNNAFMRADNVNNLRPRDQLSLSAWVYLPSTGYNPANEKHFISMWDPAGQGYVLRVRRENTSRAYIEFVVGTEDGILETFVETDDIQAGWHLITGSFDGQRASLYLDGIFVMERDNGTPTQIEYNPGIPLFVGARSRADITPAGWPTTLNNQYTQAFEGAMDEILIWDQPLNRLMVSSLYHNGADIIYETEVTPPTPPLMVQENQRATMFTDTLFATVDSCIDEFGVAISGVLVNEGTRPDKQDDRWNVCRTRRGSFNYGPLTEGGHTVTFWFKDRAGNVSEVSSDIVVDYLNLDLPRSNAYWPLDENHFLSYKTRDVISETKEHELVAMNFDTPANLEAGFVNRSTTGPDSVAMDLDGGAYLTGYINRFLRPVNELSISGWFYLDKDEIGSSRRYLVNNFYNPATASQRRGYALYVNTSHLRFKTYLDIAGETEVSIPFASLPASGWMHIAAVFDGTQQRLYVDGSELVAGPVLEDPDFVLYDEDTNFVVGAQSNRANLPDTSMFFNSAVDELAVWGLALTPGEVESIFELGRDGERLELPQSSPANVSNAFVYHYDNFGSRARMTVLDCQDRPYIYVNEEGAGAPSPNSRNWRDCATDPGAIVSATLPHGTDHVHVWSRNAHGEISSTPAIQEIPAITWEHDELAIPYAYFSFNEDHIAGNATNDYFLGSWMSGVTSFSVVDGADDKGVNFSPTNGGLVTETRHYLPLREGFTVSFWAHLDPDDTAERGIFSTTSQSVTNNSDIYIGFSGGSGSLKFRLYRDLSIFHQNLRVARRFTDATIPASIIPEGLHHITASYDGQNMRLYLNGVMYSEVNVPLRNFEPQVDRLIDFANIPNFQIGTGHFGSSVRHFNNIVDEVMLFNYALPQEQIYRHYLRLGNEIHSGAGAPTALPVGDIALEESDNTGAGEWATERIRPDFTLATDACDGVSAVFISSSATAPSFDSEGWVPCSEGKGALSLREDLSDGANNIYFWFMDSSGNVSASSTSLTVNYTAFEMRDFLTAYIPFDNETRFLDRALDLAGGNHISLKNVGRVDRAGGQAANFANARAYAKMRPAASGRTDWQSEEELTVSLWLQNGDFCNSSGDLREGTLLSTRDGASARGFTLDFDLPTFISSCGYSHSSSGTVFARRYLNFRLDTQDGLFQSHLPLRYLENTSTFSGYSVGEPMHLAVTYDGRRIRWYVNGNFAHESDRGFYSPIDYGTESHGMMIGAAMNNRGQDVAPRFQRDLDEVALFSRALTGAHISEINTLITSGDRLIVPGSLPSHIAEPPSPDMSTIAFALHEPSTALGSYYRYGNRIRVTVPAGECSDLQMLLVNDSATAPDADDENWQPCNEFEGGILSAPMAIGPSVTPRVWHKNFFGFVSQVDDLPHVMASLEILEAEKIPRPNLHWSFDDSATDGALIYESLSWFETHDEYFGELSAAGSSFEGALLGGGVDFNGVDGYAVMPARPEAMPYEKMTLSVWAELVKGETGSRYLVSNHSNVGDPLAENPNVGSGLRLRNGQLEFFVRTQNTSGNADGAFYSVGVDTTLYESGFRHIVGTFDGYYLRLYLDGVHVATRELWPFWTGVASQIRHIRQDRVSPWIIGAKPDGERGAMGEYYNRRIDDIQIWHTDLSAEQITSLYVYGIQYGFSAADPLVGAEVGVEPLDNQSTLTSPFGQLTMARCQDNAGTPVNAVYVIPQQGGPSPAAPEYFADSGWQYCSEDEGAIETGLLSQGETTLYIYYRDENGNVVFGDQIEVVYIPPKLSNPLSYHSFDSATVDPVNSEYYQDQAGDFTMRKHRLHNPGGPFFGRVDGGHSYYSYTSYVLGGHASAYELEDDFTVSFWYRPSSTTTGRLFRIPEVIDILRESDHRVRASVKTSGSIFWRTMFSQDTLKVTSSSSPVAEDPYWNHIAVSRRGDQVTLFLNGRIENTITATGSLRVPTGILEMGQTIGFYDEFALYREGLTNDQVQYLFYRGNNREAVFTQKRSSPALSIPDHYFTFSEADIVLDDPLDESPLGDDRLLDLGLVGSGGDGLEIYGDIVRDFEDNIVSGERTFDFKRCQDYHDGSTAHETTSNRLCTHADFPSDTPQYLEGDPIDLGQEFMISTWVKFTKPWPNLGDLRPWSSYEEYTILSQWGDTIEDRSYRMTLRRSSRDSNNMRFEVVLHNPDTGQRTTQNVDTWFDSDVFPNLLSGVGGWNHFAVKRDQKGLTFYVNGVPSGFRALPASWADKPVNMGTAPFRIADVAETYDVGINPDPGVNPGNPQRYDKKRFVGRLAEMAIWRNESLDPAQIMALYKKNSQNARISLLPDVVAELFYDGDKWMTDSSTGRLIISDCGTFEEVKVIPQGGDPVTDGVWVTCDGRGMTLEYPGLVEGVDNDLRVHFGPIGGPSEHFVDVTIHYEDTSTAAPAPLAMAHTDPLDSLVYFSVDVGSCGDVYELLISHTSEGSPDGSESDWRVCGTSTEYKFILDGGDNDISVWFRNIEGVISSTSTDFTDIEYEHEDVPEQSLGFDFFDSTLARIGAFESVSEELFKVSHADGSETLLNLNSPSFINNVLALEVNQSLSREGVGLPGDTQNFTLSSWVNLSGKDSRSVLFAVWNEDEDEDQFAIDVTADRRVCVSYQTTDSDGLVAWGTDEYRRVCSTRRVRTAYWHHLAFIKDGTNGALYIDGEEFLDFAMGTNATLKASTLDLRIGDDESGLGRGANARFDLIQIWDVALSVPEVRSILSSSLYETEENLRISPSSEAIAGDLDAYLDFNGNFVDSEGLLNLELAGHGDGPVANYEDPGFIGESFVFDGETRLQSEVDEHLLALGSQFTISTWVYIDEDYTEWIPLFRQWGAADLDRTISFGLNENLRPTVTVMIDGAQSNIISHEDIVATRGEWIHVLVTRDNEQMYLYLNGEAVAYTADLSSNSINTTSSTPYTIGGRADTTANSLEGMMDEFAIWLAPANEKNVRQIYEDGVSGAPLIP